MIFGHFQERDLWRYFGFVLWTYFQIKLFKAVRSYTHPVKIITDNFCKIIVRKIIVLDNSLSLKGHSHKILNLTFYWFYTRYGYPKRFILYLSEFSWRYLNTKLTPKCIRHRGVNLNMISLWTFFWLGTDVTEKMY